MSECVKDLEAAGQLRRLEIEVDATLEAGAIQRRVYQAGGPALLFTRVKGCPFPLLGNLFGTLERTRFLFRDTLDSVQRLVALKVSPAAWLKNPRGLSGRSQGSQPPLPPKGPQRTHSGPYHPGQSTAPAQVLA